MNDQALKRAAVLLGRKGGRKGGPARALKLSAERKQAIARAAAGIRWARYRARKQEASKAQES